MEEKLSPFSCVQKVGPVTQPCKCREVCAASYGEEVRRLRAAVVAAKGAKAKDEAASKWRKFIEDYADKI